MARLTRAQQQERTRAAVLVAARQEFAEYGYAEAKIDRIADTIPPLQVDDPRGRARVLVLGWGSTYGPIAAAIRLVRGTGVEIAQAHLRHLNPFPPNLGEVLRSYDRVIVPEMNLGQLALLLRARFLVDVQSLTSVRGLPFSAAHLAEQLHLAVAETTPSTQEVRS